MNAMIAMLALVAAQVDASQELMSVRVGPEVAACIQNCQSKPENNMSPAPVKQVIVINCVKCEEQLAAKAKILHAGKSRTLIRIEALEKDVAELRASLAERPAVEQQGGPDPRVDELAKKVEELRKESEARRQIDDELEKIKSRLNDAEAAIKINQAANDKRSDFHEERLNAVEKGLREVKSAYKLYDDTNPFSVSVGPRMGFMILGGATMDRQSHAFRPNVFSGFTAGPRLALSLKSWASLFAEGNVVASPFAVTGHSVFNPRPLSLNGRVGADLFPLGFTSLPSALKGFGLEVGASTTWTGYSTDLKAQSALFMGEIGVNWRWQIFPRWLALFVGVNLLAGAEFKAGQLPGPAGGVMFTAGIDF